MNRFHSLLTLLCFIALNTLSGQVASISAEIHDPAGQVYRGEFKAAGKDNGHTFYDFFPIRGMGLFWDGKNWTISVDDYPNIYFQANTNVDTPAPPSLAAGKWNNLKAGWQLVAFSEVGTPLVMSLREFSPVSCKGATDASVQAGASGGTGTYAFSWSDGTATGASTQQLSRLRNLASGSYSVTITDGNDTVEGQIEVGEPDVLEAALLRQSDPACHGANTGAATVTVTGGTSEYAYAWSNGANTATVTNLVAGPHSVTVTDFRGCTATAAVTLAEPGPLRLTAGVDAQVNCFAGTDGAASATASGGTAPYRYAWSNGATSPGIVGAPAGSYAVTVTDAGDCSVSTQLVIAEPEVLVTTVQLDATVSCNAAADGGTTAAVSGGLPPYSFIWSNGATTASLAGLVAGAYTVTVTDANGCTATSSNTLTEPEPFLAAATANAQVSCFGSANGAASAIPSGGMAPYTYSWSNGATTARLTDLTAGTYVLTVTDQSGCSATSSVVLKQNPPLRITGQGEGDSGVGDGKLTAAVSGGAAPYSYTWNTEPIQTTATAVDLAVGVYQVTVTDAAGCTANATLRVRLAVAGDHCNNPLDVDALLGGAIGTTRTSLPTDNGRYFAALAGAGDWGTCLSAGDSLYHPVYYRFTGDGNTYHLRTAAGASAKPLVNGDTRGVLFSGACGAMTYVACNDEESAEAANLWMEVSTEEGVAYTLMVDGESAASGEYALEFTRVSSTAITPIYRTVVGIYPNPTADRVTIDGITARRVDIHDGFGRRVARHINPGTEVDMQELPAGVYYLRITDHQRRTYSARVVKQ